ncbi:UNVERIFIED_CONTAM: hypothetical protein FKN15_006243 [Acipenser sinensis]
MADLNGFTLRVSLVVTVCDTDRLIYKTSQLCSTYIKASMLSNENGIPSKSGGQYLKQVPINI